MTCRFDPYREDKLRKDMERAQFETSVWSNIERCRPQAGTTKKALAAWKGGQTRRSKSMKITLATKA